LGLCHPCPGNLTTNLDKQNYTQNLIRLKKLLSGQFTAVKLSLKKQMVFLSDHQNYEQAGLVKNYLQSLDYLLTIPISPDEYLQNPNLTQDLRQQSIDALSDALNISKLTRIEMYDNAHLSGTSATSAMTVAINGELKNSLYRHFTLKKSKTDSDVDMMIEVMTRRFKNFDWPVPDLIVLDGGKPQLSSVKNLIPKNIPVVSLAKQFETIVIPVGDSYREVKLPKNHPGLQLLQNLRDEAHRFSRRLHHKHRKVAQFA
jgi:excinuclease ABC subunit C